jgi:hypothetical protein
MDELFLMVSVALKSVPDQVYMAACLAVHKNAGSSDVYIWLLFSEGLRDKSARFLVCRAVLKQNFNSKN